LIPALTGVAAKMPAGVGAPAPIDGAAASGATFDQVLGQVFNGVVESLQKGESAAVQGLQGNIGPMQVVEAVMGAQRTLQATLAIRDKAVSAYQEITRMAI
jgi:flagellar hook-basal body complex protein FliE